MSSFVGEFKPTYFGFGKFVKGVKPADLELEVAGVWPVCTIASASERFTRSVLWTFACC